MGDRKPVNPTSRVTYIITTDNPKSVRPVVLSEGFQVLFDIVHSREYFS